MYHNNHPPEISELTARGDHVTLQALTRPVSIIESSAAGGSRALNFEISESDAKSRFGLFSFRFCMGQVCLLYLLSKSE